MDSQTLAVNNVDAPTQRTAQAGRTDGPAAFQARYLANLAALYRCDGALAARLDALPFAALPPLEPARDGHWTVQLETDAGRPLYAHSRYAPLEEARKWAAAREETENPVFVVAGLGLGYHLLELERRFTRPLLIVAEEDLRLIKAALCVVDVARLLEKRRLIFLTAADKGALHEKLFYSSVNLLLGLRFATTPVAAQRQAAFQARLRALFQDFIAYSRLQMVTLLKNARITCKNMAFNLPHYLAQPGIEVLKNRAAGRPAIVIAAGPSLARHIGQLAELRERAVLIAVQTVFKPLLALGVRPHFVTTLDYHEISARFFDDVAPCGDCALVAEPKAAWAVLDAYKGRQHVLHHRFLDDLLRDAAPARGALKAGSTVAHLAFYLAQHLGCDPIILVGQDLCFSEGLYYPPGMPIETIWRPELGRFQTVEMKQWERIVRARAILRVVQDIHGRDAYTDDQLFAYAEQFQSDFLASAARVIHAGEAGMRLAGTEVMPLRAAVERFCGQPLPPDLLRETSAAPPPDFKEKASRALEERLREIGEIKRIAREMVPLLETLTTLLDRPTEFNRALARVDDLRLLMQKHDRTYMLVLDVSQFAELRRYKADREFAEEDNEAESVEIARRRLRRDREFVAAFLDGCDYLERLLPQALQRIRESMP